MRENRIMTVLGPIPPKELGQTLMHEHVLSKGPGFSDLLANEVAQIFGGTLPHRVDEVTLENLTFLKSGGGLASPVLGLDDPDLARAELELFRAAGGEAIVDATPIRMGRDPQGLRNLSFATGVTIVVATGFYSEEFWPPEFFDLGVPGMIETMLTECAQGIDGTGILPGFIKTAANRLNDITVDRLTAAALASRETGMSVQVHNGNEISAADSLVLFESMLKTGLDAERIIWAHAHNLVSNRSIVGMLRDPASAAVDVSPLLRVLDHGASVGIDCFGPTSDFEATGIYDADERTMLLTLAELLRHGHAGQIVLGHDVMWKLHYHRYGGHGYTRILDFVIPKLIESGYRDREVKQLLVENPARLLTF